MIVEGMGLDPEFSIRMQEKYGNECLNLALTSIDEHIQRSKLRCLNYNPRENKYVNSYPKIEAIQKHILGSS